VRQGFVRVPEAEVHYVEAGEGPPVVLVHGLAGSWRWWGPILETLTREHRVLAFDLPGFGLSRGSKLFSLKSAGEQVCQIMGALGLEQADLIGHSMGARICMDVAARCPERVRKLVVVSAVGQPWGKPRVMVGWDLLREGWVNAPKYPELIKEDTSRVKWLELCLTTYELLSDDFSDRLGQITAPTKIIWGGRDVLTPPALGEQLAALIPRAELTVFEEAGHTPMWDAPGEFCRVVGGFLGVRGTGVRSRGAGREGVGAREAAVTRLLPARVAARVA
jgi:pimeloyl-ACP methyl ester carboxylesterase